MIQLGISRLAPPPAREVRSYTDLATAAAFGQAAGTGRATPYSVGAAEASVSAWSRSLAVCALGAPPWARDALGPDALADMGRRLATDGNFVALVGLRGGRLVITPASAWDLRGGAAAETWRYRLTTAGPTETTSTVVGRDSVIHVAINPDPMQPWRGRSPLGVASETAAALANVERSLRDTFSGPVGSIVPMPAATDPDDPDDENGSTAATYTNILKGLRGGLSVAETMMDGGGDKANAPAGDWSIRRIGPMPSDQYQPVRADVAQSVYAAFGIPVELLAGGAAAAAAREGWRRFVNGTMAPIALIVEAELRRAVDASVTVDPSPLLAGDRSGAARALKGLTDAGIPLPEARALLGL